MKKLFKIIGWCMGLSVLFTLLVQMPISWAMHNRQADTATTTIEAVVNNDIVVDGTHVTLVGIQLNPDFDEESVIGKAVTLKTIEGEAFAFFEGEPLQMWLLKNKMAVRDAFYSYAAPYYREFRDCI